MSRISSQTQYFEFSAEGNSNLSYEPGYITLDLSKSEEQTCSQPQTTTASLKQPSKLGILILALVTMALYSFSLKELSTTVVELVESAIQVVVRDYEL